MTINQLVNIDKNQKHCTLKKAILINSAWLILLISLLNFLAIFFFSWYWTVWWFDIVMHFLGGLWIALLALWLFYKKFVTLFEKGNIGNIIVITFLVVLAVAFLWEVFEFSLDTFIAFKKQSIFDTISDILLGLAGGMTGSLYFIFKKSLRYKNINS